MLLEPSAALKKDDSDPGTGVTQLYKALRIFGVELFKRCEDSEAKGWVQPSENGGYAYPVTTLDHTLKVLASQPVIISPDGSIWREGTLFLLRQALDDDKKDPETLMAMASHLADFMNTLASEGRDFLDFSGYRFEYPTYAYKETFKLPTKIGAMAVGTANTKIRTVIKFYKDLMENRSFVPHNDPWKTKRSTINYEDAYGYVRTKYITHTDLTFQTVRPNPMGRYIADGGRLIPLSKRQQMVLLKALVEIAHPEMLLVFVIALVTGMRIQTVLTLRISTIKIGAADSFELIPIRAGRGSLVDTKHGKPQAIMMPSWLHHKLTIYLNSERYKHRVALSPLQPEGAEYLFVSSTGIPYYVAKDDRHRFKSCEKGSYVRRFIAKYLKPMMSALNCEVNFSFHDLRATFGMNLVEERREMLNRGQINLLQLIDHVRMRMNHTSSETTQQYLNFQQDKETLYVADQEYQQHIIDMCKEKY